MQVRTVHFRDLGRMEYAEAWDYQEKLLSANLRLKSAALGMDAFPGAPLTQDHLLFVEHSPVFTLGKSGDPQHVLIGPDEREQRGIQFINTNRGGDITYHGPGQLVGYPILDLEHFFTDIGRYMRSLEEILIRVLGDFAIQAGRLPGATGVWLDPSNPIGARKIAALGVRCSRWVTMHGFALNVNTDLSYFRHIIPCGLSQGQVTSMEKELGNPVPMEEVKIRVRGHFEAVFGAVLREKEEVPAGS
jgi:lipoyl(octanoyl) transferase